MAKFILVAMTFFYQYTLHAQSRNHSGWWGPITFDISLDEASTNASRLQVTSSAFWVSGKKDGMTYLAVKPVIPLMGINLFHIRMTAPAKAGMASNMLSYFTGTLNGNGSSLRHRIAKNIVIRFSEAKLSSVRVSTFIDPKGQSLLVNDHDVSVAFDLNEAGETSFYELGLGEMPDLIRMRQGPFSARETPARLIGDHSAEHLCRLLFY